MTIRLATLADIPQVLQLVNDVIPLMQTEGNFQWDVKYPTKAVFENDIVLEQLWVADIEGKIAGITAITTDQEAEYAQVGWDITEPAIVTHRLAVNVNYRGMGVAAALLKQAEMVAEKRGIKTLRIDTNTQNKATQVLFPKAGYVFMGEISLAFCPGLRFYCYEKLIGE